MPCLSPLSPSSYRCLRASAPLRYLYANQQGCDGERVYYDGCAMIVCNGEILAQASQFSLNDVEVVAATVDLDDVVTYRTSCMSRCAQAAEVESFPKIEAALELTARRWMRTTEPMEARIHSPEEEIALGPACWLWDYLRRTGLAGYFLPLSGGIDSTSTVRASPARKYGASLFTS